MRKFVPNLVVVGAFGLVTIVGTVAYVTAGKLAVLLDPSATESHLLGFMIAVTGVAVAVGSAFPIFGRGIPWLTARLERAWPLSHVEPAQVRKSLL